MPAEPTKAKLKRRSSRKDLDEYRLDGSHLRELETKRSRGEVSCAECRRLKIKCDKQIPCQSCLRRGCESLCPNGILATGQGTRFVLAATEHLHKRIAKLKGRIRQLEDALATVHGKDSVAPHPLLQEDLISSEDHDGDLDAVMEDPRDGTGTPAKESLESFGSLSVSEHGISRFFGFTGGPEMLLLANLDPDHEPSASCRTPESRDSGSPSATSELQYFSQAFPFTPTGNTIEVKEFIASQLPPYADVLKICDLYFEQVAWVFRCISRTQIDEMLACFYKRSPLPTGEDYSGPHDLALIFMVLALATLVAQNSDALGEHYYQIARASVSLQPVLERPSYITIQVLHLMSIYNAMSGSDLASETTMEMTWSLITLASHLSQTIGLHRDSARWGLTPQMVQRRRVVFWDLFVADIWQSLCTGRPPSFSLAYIDCPFPHYDDDSGDGANFGSIYEVWQYRFAAEIVAEVAARTLTTDAPSYSTILELDQKVRNFPMPETKSPSEDFGASSQRCVLEHIRETVLMYIHRSFFAQAIIENPGNPLKSQYARSFLAAYRASSTILKSVKEQYAVWANTTARFWTMWTFAFSAAVVFGTVVTRGPRSPLAKEAMGELDQACHLFAKASQCSLRAAKALPVLIRLSEKAKLALQAAESNPSTSDEDHGGLLWSLKQEEDDELAILAGRTRLVSSKRTSPPTSEGSPADIASTFSSMNSSHSVMDHQPISRDQSAHLYRPVLQPSLLGARSDVRNEPSSSTSVNQLTTSANPRWTEPGLPMNPYPMRYNYTSPAPQRSHPLSSYGWSSEDISGTQRPRHPSQHYDPNTDRNPSVSYHLPPINQRSIRDTAQSSYLPYPSSHAHQATPPGPAGQHHAYPISRSSTMNEQYSGYLSMEQYQGHSQPPGVAGSPTMVLADLGLASRDSRLDERWGMFMADSGILEDFRR